MSHPDVIIIGGGPAGLAAAATLQEGGLRVRVYEQGALADSIRRWPYYLRFFSTAANVELGDVPLIVTDDKPTREEYLNYLRRFVRAKRLDVRTRHRVETVTRAPSAAGEPPAAGAPPAARDASAALFTVTGTDAAGDPFTDQARWVVVATGAFDFARPLGVPGEDLPKVTHYFTEVHPYADSRVAVVGGGTSAVETALLLWRAGAEVTMVVRAGAFRGLKYWQEPDIRNRIANGEIRALMDARVVEILPRELVVEQEGRTLRLPNDFVLAMTGYQPDVALLRGMGVEMRPDTMRPVHNQETLETNVPGLYVAGVVIAGNVGGEIFIENARAHGEVILRALKRAPILNSE